MPVALRGRERCIHGVDDVAELVKVQAFRADLIACYEDPGFVLLFIEIGDHSFAIFHA